MKPYVIITPDFAHMCSGITTLHRLCHMLNERGFEAYTTGYTAGPEYPKLCKAKSTHFLSVEKCHDMQRNGIVVHPDIAPGNSLRFNNVVRWWVGIPIYVPEHELVFSLAENHDFLVKVKNHLCIWHIEDEFRSPEVENRIHTCYTIHKGRGRPRLPETTNSIEIEGFSRTQVRKLLQTSSILYSYDDCTLLTVESRLCGCPAKILNYNTFSKETLAASSFSTYAMALPGEEVNLDKLRSELPAFYAAYAEREAQTERELDNFIELTQNMDMPYIENPMHDQDPQTWLPWNQFGPRV